MQLTSNSLAAAILKYIGRKVRYISCLLITQITHKVATHLKQDSHVTERKCTRAKHVEVDMDPIELINLVAEEKECRQAWLTIKLTKLTGS